MWKLFAFAICSSFHQRFCVFISRCTICVYHDYHEIVYHDISSITIIVASLISVWSLTSSSSLYWSEIRHCGSPWVALCRLLDCLLITVCVVLLAVVYDPLGVIQVIVCLSISILIPSYLLKQYLSYRLNQCARTIIIL